MNKTVLGILFAIFLIFGIGGYLLLQTNENSDQSEVRTATERTVNLFYYDPSRDQDAAGNVMCTERGLVPVSRTIVSVAPIEETLRLLLSGGLTAEERAQGITTEYPLAGVSLTSVVLSETGELTVALDDPQHQTGGGSCRVAILWAQIRATALQFPEVRAVSFQPEDLFQP